MPAYSRAAVVPAAAALAAASAPVRAAASGDLLSELDAPPSIPTGESVIGNLIWVVIALLIVIALIVLLLRFLSGRSRAWGANRALRALGGVALGQNKSLQVVDVAGQLYIVGVGEDVTLLDKIDDPEQAEAIIRLLEDRGTPVWDASGLKSVIDRMRAGRQSARQDEAERPAEEFRSVLEDKLRRQATNKQKVESLLKDSNHTDRLMDE